MLIALILLILISIALGVLAYYQYENKKADLAILTKQQKMLEDALAEISEKESSLRAVFQHSNAGIFICTATDYKLTFANDILADMLQVHPEHYHDISIISYIGEQDREKVMNQLQKVVEGEAGALRMDVLVEGEQDFQSWIDLSVSPVLVKNEVRLLIGIAVDNTNKKIYKQKLETTEVRFRQLVDNLDDVIGLIDRVGKILYYNKAGLEYHKQTAEEIYGKYFYDYYDPEDAEKIMEIKERAFATKKVSRGIINFALLGEEYWVDLTAIPIIEKDGSVKRIQAIGKNVTAQIRMLNDLKNAKQRLELIMQGLPDVVYSAIYDLNDQQVVFDYLSPKIEDLTGYRMEYFISGPNRFNELVIKEDLQEFDKFAENIQKADTYQLNLRIRHKSGQIINVTDHLRAEKLNDHKLRVSGTVRKIDQAG